MNGIAMLLVYFVAVFLDEIGLWKIVDDDDFE
jgi:hypothetical protein